MKFMVMVWAAFLARVKPVSTIAKPACMNMTRKPATSVQTRLMAVVLSATDLATSSILGAAAAASAMSRARVMALLERKELPVAFCKGGTSATQRAVPSAAKKLRITKVSVLVDLPTI